MNLPVPTLRPTTAKPTAPASVAPVQNPEPMTPPKPVIIPRDWLTIAILTLILAVIWITLGIYFTLTKSTIPEPVREHLTKLQPVLDEKVLDELEKKSDIAGEVDEQQRVIYDPENPPDNGSPSPTNEPVP